MTGRVLSLYAPHDPIPSDMHELAKTMAPSRSDSHSKTTSCLRPDRATGTDEFERDRKACSSKLLSHFQKPFNAQKLFHFVKSHRFRRDLIHAARRLPRFTQLPHGARAD